MIREELTKIFREEVQGYKDQYKLFSGAIDTFISLESTQNNLEEYVIKVQNHWWKWFSDGDPNVQQDIINKHKAHHLMQFEKSFYNYEGYISKSWLFYKAWVAEVIYTNTIKKQIWEDYVRKEIPKRGRDKIRKIANIGE